MASPRLIFLRVWLARTCLSALSAAGLATPAAAETSDIVYGDGFEGVPPAHLIVHYPAGAQSISARGSAGGLSWAQGVAMARTGDTFTRVLQIAAPAEWKPVLDDVTFAIGPNYPVGVGQTVEIWPHFTTTQGQTSVLIASFASTVLGNSRPIYVYLPPTYVENSLATMPVIYMQDGQNMFASHPEWSTFGNTWAVDTAFDTASNDGSIKEAIVIGVANTTDRLNEYTPTVDPNYMTGGKADAYLQMLVTELKPTVDVMLRTRTDAASTLIGGSSLGGLLAAYAGRTTPTVFGRIAALSPSAWWDNEVIVSDVQTTPPAPNRPLRVYVDSGDSSSDTTEPSVTALASAYVSAGYIEGTDLRHVIQAGGQFNETYWAQRFPGAMAFLLGTRDAQ